MSVYPCLVPSPHYSARLMHFESRGPSEFLTLLFVSDTSPKFIGPGGLGRRCEGQGNVQTMSFENDHLKLFEEVT